MRNLHATQHIKPHIALLSLFNASSRNVDVFSLHVKVNLIIKNNFKDMNRKQINMTLGGGHDK